MTKKKQMGGYKNGKGGMHLTVTLYGTIADKVLAHAEISQTTAEQWVAEAIEIFLNMKRSNKFTGDPNRHDLRNDCDDDIYYQY